jgi:type II secretory pathway component PulF
MSAFTYRAVDKTGYSVNGTMEATDEAQLEQLLLDVGYWLVEAKTIVREKKRDIRAKVSRRELIELCSALNALLDAGVTIIDALNTMTNETSNEGFRHALEDLTLNIEAGSTLTEAMARHPHIFSKQITNIVKAGEFAGNLATSFGEVMRHLEWVDELVADLKQVSIYPAMVLFAVGMFVLLLFGFVVPTFAELLAQLDLALPLVTRLVMSVGDFVSEYFLLIAGLPAATIFGYLTARKSSHPFALAADKFKFKIPIVGDILRMISLSRLAHNMAMLMRAGVAMQQALNLSRDLVGNLAVSEAIKDAELAVTDGQTVSSAFRRYSFFSPMIMRMIVVGEETGTMEHSMEHVSKRFDNEIPRRIKKLMSILEPTIIIALIGLVGTVAMAIFLPFLELMGGIL